MSKLSETNKLDDESYTVQNMLDHKAGAKKGTETNALDVSVKYSIFNGLWKMARGWEDYNQNEADVAEKGKVEDRERVIGPHKEGESEDEAIRIDRRKEIKKLEDAEHFQAYHQSTIKDYLKRINDYLGEETGFKAILFGERCFFARKQRIRDWAEIMKHGEVAKDADYPGYDEARDIDTARNICLRFVKQVCTVAEKKAVKEGTAVSYEKLIGTAELQAILETILPMDKANALFKMRNALWYSGGFIDKEPNLTEDKESNPTNGEQSKVEIDKQSNQRIELQKIKKWCEIRKKYPSEKPEKDGAISGKVFRLVFHPTEGFDHLKCWLRPTVPPDFEPDSPYDLRWRDWLHWLSSLITVLWLLAILLLPAIVDLSCKLSGQGRICGHWLCACGHWLCANQEAVKTGVLLFSLALVRLKWMIQKACLRFLTGPVFMFPVAILLAMVIDSCSRVKFKALSFFFFQLCGVFFLTNNTQFVIIDPSDLSSYLASITRAVFRDIFQQDLSDLVYATCGTLFTLLILYCKGEFKKEDDWLKIRLVLSWLSFTESQLDWPSFVPPWVQDRFPFAIILFWIACLIHTSRWFIRDLLLEVWDFYSFPQPQEPVTTTEKKNQ